jgi:hypothetical protein
MIPSSHEENYILLGVVESSVGFANERIVFSLQMIKNCASLLPFVSPH